MGQVHLGILVTGNYIDNLLPGVYNVELTFNMSRMIRMTLVFEIINPEELELDLHCEFFLRKR